MLLSAACARRTASPQPPRATAAAVRTPGAGPEGPSPGTRNLGSSGQGDDGARGADGQQDDAIARDLVRAFDDNATATAAVCAAAAPALADVEVRDLRAEPGGGHSAEVIASPAPAEGQEGAAPPERCRARFAFRWEPGGGSPAARVRDLRLIERLPAPRALH
jgi:hypothetical protein